MPEYLAPGVYVEETSFRAKTIEGVSTSICGMIGPTRYGPVGGEPELITSFPEFERLYGGIDRLTFREEGGAEAEAVENYLAYGVRSFFDNGGTKLYVTRVYGRPDDAEADYGHATLQLPADASPPELTLTARFPGSAGNMRLRMEARVGENALFDADGTPGLRNVRSGDVVFVGRGAIESPPVSPPAGSGFFTAQRAEDGSWTLADGGPPIPLTELDPAEDEVSVITLLVGTQASGRFDVEQTWGEFSLNADRSDSLTRFFTREPDSRRRRLVLPIAMESEADGHRVAEALFPDLALALQGDLSIRRAVGATAEQRRSARLARTRALSASYALGGGHDGLRPTHIDYEGRIDGTEKSGLRSLEDLEEISILAAPGYSELYNATEADQIQQHLIGHAETMRYCIVVLDSRRAAAISEVRGQRARIDTTRAALYYPWITVVDPFAPRGAAGSDAELHLPPSGFVAGIYARNDVERGVHKAPANEVVRGAVGLEVLLSKAQQDVLNPDGVNCFRYFEGRGYRVWGARTASSDPEWKYVNVRRLFLYLERSIEKGTQWVVFENNSHQLWARVRRTVEDFLFNEWNNGALMGTKPEEAYFVRCDRTTMTQNDIDNGRLVCLIGVAPVRPAEFVIFRIGQWTADKPL